MKPYIKTSLSPGSGVVSQYFNKAGLTPFFDALGFNLAGYGCMTCIGNSGELDQEVVEAITKGDLVVSSVLSGNRNFEGRVHPLVRANYLASPPLVVAYALAGRVTIDFEVEPLGNDTEGKPVFLRDIWPGRNDVQKVEASVLTPEMFVSNYEAIVKGTERWNTLEVPQGVLYKWPESTYIHKAPFFDGMTKDLPVIKDVIDGRIFAIFGDSITTDHISPAGNIAKSSPGGRYLVGRGITPQDFNTYGSRRGHDEVMARGTFANIRIINKMNGGKVGPQTIHVPSGETLDFFDAADKYIKEGIPTVILAGNEYGCGSSRDWAAKG